VAFIGRVWTAHLPDVLAGASVVLWIVFAVIPNAILHCGEAVADESAPVYEAGMRDVLAARCVACHDSKRREGGLDLSSPEGLLSGGDSGAVIDRAKPAASLLLERVVSGEMPPKDSSALSANQLAVVRHWLEGGAKFRTPPKERRLTEHDVIPILLLRCTACHGTRRQDGGLDLRTRESILKGGNSGPVVVPERPAESRLVKRVRHEEMPPRRLLVSVSVKPMTESELSTIESWIRAGLPESVPEDVAAAASRPEVSDEDRSFWAFRPPQEQVVPHVGDASLRPVDAFVTAELAEHGLTLAPPADRLTLLRRVSLDLTGLPPTPTEIDEFLEDTTAGNWQRLIDRLLDSPRYGERWARHWLDAVGYADSEGAQNEDRVRPHLWRYRDYVIRAFNSDKPYDRFLLEQIAGDELADYSTAKEITQEVYENIVATGFLRTTPDRTFANITNFVPDRLEVIADGIQVFSSAVLGLTMHCARCHDHKFDPLSQRDYYSLSAILKDGYDEHDWLKSQGPRTLPHVTTAERSEWERTIRQLDADIAELNKQADAATNEDQRLALKKQAREIEQQKPIEPRIRALWSRGQPSPTYLLRRGNHLTPGPLVEPDVPAVLAPRDFDFKPETPFPNGSVTGRRLALARWMTQPDHPLTARVFVNRVWKHHFGRGLVASVANFGKTGEMPSHPELLDWLAIEFVKHGSSVKWLHREILSSRTWQQTSALEELATHNGEPVSEEQRTQWLYGAPLRRLDAEGLRDSLLSVAGQLDVTPFGPPDGVDERADGLITSKRSAAGWRRSVFVQQRRTKIPTLLENFDFPQMGPNCLERSEAIVAPQALHLLNNSMVHDLAGYFADRVIKMTEQTRLEDAGAQIDVVYLLAISRHPDTAEREAGIATLLALRTHWRNEANATTESAARNALASFCHATMNSAAFLYID